MEIKFHARVGPQGREYLCNNCNIPVVEMTGNQGSDQMAHVIYCRKCEAVSGGWLTDAQRQQFLDSMPVMGSGGFAFRVGKTSANKPREHVIMAELSCDTCEAKYILTHFIAYQDSDLAKKQGDIVQRSFAQDHLSKAEHPDTLELPPWVAFIGS